MIGPEVNDPADGPFLGKEAPKSLSVICSEKLIRGDDAEGAALV